MFSQDFSVDVSKWLSTQGSYWTQAQPAGLWGFHLFDLVNCVLLIWTLATIINSNRLAKSALNRGHAAYVRSLTDTRYDAMDRIYLDLVRTKREFPIKMVASERPQNRTGTNSDMEPQLEVSKDDPYPLMMWNFIETIIDKCEKDDSGELMKTWGPLVSAEARNHGVWMLKADENGQYVQSPYFKNEFMLLARSLVPISKSILAQGADVDFPVFLRLFRALEDQQIQLGLTAPSPFTDMFAKVYSDPALTAQAGTKEKWDIPESIRDDAVRNNEKARKDHHKKNHAALMRSVATFIHREQATVAKKVAGT